MLPETQPIYTLFSLLFTEELINLEDSSERFILFLTTTQNMSSLTRTPKHDMLSPTLHTGLCA
jgi:hypothetical protein